MHSVVVLLVLLFGAICSSAFVTKGPDNIQARKQLPLAKQDPVSQSRRKCRTLNQFSSSIQMSNPFATTDDAPSEERAVAFNQRSPLIGLAQLILTSFIGAILLISWEEVSMHHPMRQQPLQQIRLQESAVDLSYHWGDSTVRGMAFGRAQRIRLDDAEPQDSQSIPSYNEVMLEHRTERVPSWQNGAMTEGRVRESVATVQKTVTYLQECKQLARDYDWDGLTLAIRKPTLHKEIQAACNNLKHADGYLSPEARDEIGFEWASCAWRHCGALADAQEAIDELDHLIGILEPFECLFCLDIVERSLYDILAVTQKYQDASIPVPEYQPLQRKSDVGEEGVDQFDAEYLEALEFLKKFED